MKLLKKALVFFSLLITNPGLKAGVKKARAFQWALAQISGSVMMR
jgi:hypothetical protein